MIRFSRIIAVLFALANALTGCAPPGVGFDFEVPPEAQAAPWPELAPRGAQDGRRPDLDADAARLRARVAALRARVQEIRAR